MGSVGLMRALISGDIGGNGMSRYAFELPGATPPVPGDCGTAYTSLMNLYQRINTLIPSDITISFDGNVEVLDPVTGAVQANVESDVTIDNVFGGMSGSYAAGVGARINWKTSSIFNRRFVRGCNFIVPLGSACYTSTGALTGDTTTAIAESAASYINDMTTGGLVPVIWGRPKTGTETGGHAGNIISGVVLQTPAGLRSRRS